MSNQITVDRRGFEQVLRAVHDVRRDMSQLRASQPNRAPHRWRMPASPGGNCDSAWITEVHRLTEQSDPANDVTDDDIGHVVLVDEWTIDDTVQPPVPNYRIRERGTLPCTSIEQLHKLHRSQGLYLGKERGCPTIQREGLTTAAVGYPDPISIPPGTDTDLLYTGWPGFCFDQDWTSGQRLVSRASPYGQVASGLGVDGGNWYDHNNGRIIEKGPTNYGTSSDPIHWSVVDIQAPGQLTYGNTFNGGFSTWGPTDQRKRYVDLGSNDHPLVPLHGKTSTEGSTVFHWLELNPTLNAAYILRMSLITSLSYSVTLPGGQSRAALMNIKHRILFGFAGPEFTWTEDREFDQNNSGLTYNAAAIEEVNFGASPGELLWKDQAVPTGVRDEIIWEWEVFVQGDYTSWSVTNIGAQMDIELVC